MQKLTEKEQKAYDYITRSIREDGISPSVRDIAEALSIKSTSTVHSLLSALEQKGWIRRESGKSRSLRASGARSSADSRRMAKVPVLGQIHAGSPVLSVQNYEGYVDFPLGNRSYDANDLFALRVKGSSMIGAGIMDGDIVVIKKEPAADNGTIVAALVDDEATLKTFYNDGSHIRLQPENPDFEPIIVRDCIILGRVVGCMRYY